MASREHTGLQAALIIFLLITVGLSITTFIYYRAYEEQKARAVAARAASATAVEKNKVIVNQVKYLKHIIGAERLEGNSLTVAHQSAITDNKFKEIDDQFVKDCKTFGAGLLEKDHYYRKFPEYLETALKQRNEQVTEAGDREKALLAKNQQLITSEAARVAEASAVRDRALEDLKKERSSFNDAVAKLKDAGRVAEDKARINAEQLQKKTIDARAEKAALEKQIAQVASQYVQLQAKLDTYRQPIADAPDGKITWVNQRSGVALIDLGEATALKRGTTFNVYDQNANVLKESKAKAKIEVVRINGSDEAEARITQSNDANPIVPGDKIHSPIWRRNQRVRVALAGLMDMDGDGRSDIGKLRPIINKGGGQIDAELLDDGSISGKITVDTRYLVKGERPTEKTPQKYRDGYTAILNEANRMRVETISMDDLLNLMGYTLDQKTESLRSGGSGGSKLRDRDKPVSSVPRTPSSPFRPRTPGGR